TVIPKMHLKFLSAEQRRHVVELTADQTNPVRHFSLYVKSDFISEKMLRSLLTSLRRVIPPHLQEPEKR
ncbi:MAG: hypothetical protein PUE05_08530, partial [bacterium]|nr:hypothetical protein [bacterium]